MGGGFWIDAIVKKPIILYTASGSRGASEFGERTEGSLRSQSPNARGEINQAFDLNRDY
jgi:hypothetical protein